MSDIDTFNRYIEIMQRRRLMVATSMLNDKSPDDLQIATAAKNANNLVQIQAGIEAATKAIKELTGVEDHDLNTTIPIAPIS
jgi:hypothetical protein